MRLRTAFGGSPICDLRLCGGLRRLCLSAIAVAGALAHGRAHAESTTWAESTRSPQPAADAKPTACGAGDRALEAVAKRVLDRKLAGGTTPDSAELTAWLRAAGDPHVWPRAWVGSSKDPRALDEARVAEKLGAWAESSNEPGEKRCGVARGARKDGTSIVVAVAITAASDLAPIPTRARIGQWLSVDAHLHVGATGARVVVMGPIGAPVTVASSIDHGRVRARFAPSTQGPFVVQVVADLDGGPRPVAEAIVFAESEPSDAAIDRAAPGERAADGVSDPVEKIARMLAAARADDGRKPLTRDPRLDALAKAHARRVAAARTVAHDAGDGNPAERLLDANLRASAVGENVAHAADIALAHRELYASASHRANMLSDDFDSFGAAVVLGDDGSAWVVEMFARKLR